MTLLHDASTREALLAGIDIAPEPVTLLVELLELHEDDPFAPQKLAQLLSRDPLIGERVRAGYSTPGAARYLEVRRPFTIRDAIDVSGYRVVHSSAVGCCVVEALGPEVLGREHAASWEWTYVVATYTLVLAEVLRSHADDAFTAGFLKGTSRLLLRRRARDEASDAAGGSDFDLARALVEAWGLPGRLLPAFEQPAAPESLANLVRRAETAAGRHAFAGLAGRAKGPRAPSRSEEREPILDAFLERRGGPEGVMGQLRAFMSSARLTFE